MNGTVQAEWLKQRTTRTTIGAMLAMLGTIALADIVHILGFTARLIDERAEQRSIMLDVGVGIGLVFAAIGGAIAITSEFRHGTVRSTLLRRPKRAETLIAKAATQVIIGAVTAALAAGFAIGLAAIFLRVRGIDLQLTTGDIGTLIVGAAFGGAMFAVIGLAIGTLVRNQVPVVVGMLLWTLFIETLLRAGVPSVGKFAPGSLARAIAGQTTAALSSSVVAGAGLGLLATIGLAAAHAVFARRDIA
jgi:ABC-2 type transport system permease protein